MVFHDFCCRVTNRFVYVFSVVVATMSPQIRWCLSGFIVHYLKCIPLNKQQQSALRSAWAKSLEHLMIFGLASSVSYSRRCLAACMYPFRYQLLVGVDVHPRFVRQAKPGVQSRFVFQDLLNLNPGTAARLIITLGQQIGFPRLAISSCPSRANGSRSPNARTQRRRLIFKLASADAPPSQCALGNR